MQNRKELRNVKPQGSASDQYLLTLVSFFLPIDLTRQRKSNSFEGLWSFPIESSGTTAVNVGGKSSKRSSGSVSGRPICIASEIYSKIPMAPLQPDVLWHFICV